MRLILRQWHSALTNKSVVNQSDGRCGGLIYRLRSSPVNIPGGKMAGGRETGLWWGHKQSSDMFASWENVRLCVCSSLSIPDDMLLPRHMVDTFKIFYKYNSRHCKERVLNSIQCVTVYSRSCDSLSLFSRTNYLKWGFVLSGNGKAMLDAALTGCWSYWDFIYWCSVFKRPHWASQSCRVCS